MSENNQLIRITETAITPFLKPKHSDLVAMIGETELKKQTSFAIQACQSNGLLMQASPASVAKCIWNSAIIGLTLNPVQKMAYLTPRRNSDGNWEAILIPSYMGLVKLITDTKSVNNIYAYPVYKGDEFEFTYGTEITITHKPKHKSTNNDDLTHVYAVAIMPDGTKQVEVMSADEVNLIRARSDGYRAFKAGKAKSAIWETDYSEMARKTVIKRITKYLPKGDKDKWERVNEAINTDNGDYPATDGQRGYIESLVSTSAYNEAQRAAILSKEDLTMNEAETIIHDLQNNQLNPITHSQNASAKEINNEVNGKIG